MTSQKLKKIGVRNAFLFILIAIALFAAYFYTSSNYFIYMEYAFVFIAGAINFIILLRIFNHVTKHKRNRRGLLITAGIIFVSLIVCFVLFRKMTALLDTMRIEFVNKTGQYLTDIKITGCQKKYIDELQPNSSKTVWINISRDCSIALSYKQGNTEKTEVVSAFITTSMGQKIRYNIGQAL